MLKFLSRWHELHLFSFAETPPENLALDELRPFCRSITIIEHHPGRGFLRRLWNILFQKDPFFIQQLKSGPAAKKLKELIESLHPDLVHFDFASTAPYLNLVPQSTPSVFFPHDAVSMLFSRNVQKERGFFRKIYMWAQKRKMTRFERVMMPLFDATVVVSPIDKTVLQERCPSARVYANPNGVDGDFFFPQPQREKNNVILFRGVMNFLPNDDAACFFAKEVMPLVWETLPEAEFWIAGPFPSAELICLGNENKKIRVMGHVDDIRDPMAQATVIVSPMRIGSGIKNKILESMAMAKAVLATEMSLAAISALRDIHLLLADTPQDLAREALRLLKDKDLRRQLGLKSREFVLKNYSWEVHAQNFSRIYEEASQKRKGRVSTAEIK